MRHAIIAVLLLAALAGTAVAGPSEDAVSKQAEAQYKLGILYGYGLPKDYAKAVRLSWAMPAPSSTSVSCTAPARAWRRTTPRR